MVLPIIMYGDPVLRRKGASIETIAPDVRVLIRDLLETMEANHGIGLAAQQVGQALQVTVVDIREVRDRPSWAERNGVRVNTEELMPLVLVNPKVTPVAPVETGPEGCLSFPELFADISRPGAVDVEALDAEGQPLVFRCGGLLARVVQHEVDHLNGILFIDRMSASDKRELQPQLDSLRTETRALLGKSPR